MEIREIVDLLRKKGRVRVKEGSGEILELISMEDWKEGEDDPNGIFLFFDTFQIRTVAEPFSEISLDIIEYASKPTIYHTGVNRVIKKGPITDENVRFSVIKKDFWNKVLFACSQPVVLQYTKDGFDFKTEEYFPLLSGGCKEMFLSPEGDVKILKG